MVNWDDLTPEEREQYVNQDYVSRKYILANVDTFSYERYNMASVYNELHIPEYCVREMLATLTPRQREVVSTVYLDGNTQDRAASILHMSRRALRTHLDRARHRLKQYEHLFKLRMEEKDEMPE